MQRRTAGNVSENALRASAFARARTFLRAVRGCALQRVRMSTGAAFVCFAVAGMTADASVAQAQPVSHTTWLTPEVRAAVRATPDVPLVLSGSGKLGALHVPGFGVVAAPMHGTAAPHKEHARGSHQPTSVPMPGGVSPWVAPLASAIIPGAGQGLLRQQRGVVYAAAEGYLVLQALRSNRDASRERDAYREIARSVARAAFGSQAPDGDWPYYERMQFILESGVFNRTPGNGFTPESDPATFNGSIWQLARETFWRDPDAAPPATSPEYQRAIEFYQRRAASDEFRWSWRDAQLEQDVYRQTIVRANEASRRTKQVVGLLLANHALSLVDSYMSVRLRVFGSAGTPGAQRMGVAGSLPLPGVGKR